MTNAIGKTNMAARNYSSGTDNSPQKADDPSPVIHKRSVSAEPPAYARGTAAWLSRQALRNDQLPPPRAHSAPPTPRGGDTPGVTNEFQEWSADRKRKAPDLDALYGSVQPPRAKPGKASGIQKAERDKDGMVIIHPGRIVLNPTITPDLPVVSDQVRRELEGGAVYKWNISRNGNLMIAKSKHPGGEKLGWGHPTLVGGLKEPEARMGGELRFGTIGEDDSEPVFYINNDSGRYGEYVDRSEEMLKNVADRFMALGFPVQEQWMDKSKVALKNPAKVSTETGSSAGMAEQSADS